MSALILKPRPTAFTSGANTPGIGSDQKAGTALGPSLLDLVELWERVRAPRSAISKAKTRLCVRRFLELFGDIRSQDVTREHAIAYRDALVSRLKPENVAGHLTRMHVLFSVAMGEGLIPTNPFHNVRVQKRSGSVSRRREGFTSEHVKAIFAALEEENEDFSWVVRLLAYHGMRSGEACQLRCDDVTVLHGVPVLRIHDLYGSLKNRASVRDIPIHPACKSILEKAGSTAERRVLGCFPRSPPNNSVAEDGSRITVAVSSARRSALRTGATPCILFGTFGEPWPESVRCPKVYRGPSWGTHWGVASMALTAPRHR